MMEYIDWKISGVMKFKNSFGFRVTLILSDGTKKVQQKSGFTTVKEAQRGRDLAVAQLYSKTYVTDNVVTVRDYYTEWLETVIKIRCKASTYFSYYYTLKNHIYPHIGGVKLAELNKAHILYLYRLVGEKHESVVKQCRVILKTGLRLAKMNHLISEDPAKDVLIPKDIYEATPYHKMNINSGKTLTVEQLKLLIEKSRDTNIYLFILFAGLMGLRKSEILGLKYCDIDLVHRTLHVQRQLGRDLSKVNVKSKTKTKQEIGLKSQSSNRILNIPDIVFEAILEERQRYEINRHRRIRQFQDLDYICCST
ncbi:MAG: tyrosine-type recombinase/integrase family protein, partial [Tyzzerella sp.]|nr:tyrosine-type recombinase/integrase family protein [Tyzzerella sp.]